MVKQLPFKLMLLLCALVAGVSSAWAEKITDYLNIVDGAKYYIGATTGGTDYYLSVDGSSLTNSIAGTAVNSKEEATVFIFLGNGNQWTIQFDGSAYYLSLKTSKDNGKVQVVDEPAVFTASNQSGKFRLSKGSYSIQKNNSGAQFGSYGNTQTDIWLEPALSDNDLSITSSTEVNLTITNETPNPTSTVVWTTSSSGALTWATSNSAVATVNNGIITAQGSGTANITVSQAETSSYAASDTKTIVVTVTDNTKNDCDLALTGAPIALNFDLYNNSSAQTVYFTTSSTGSVTITGGEGYVTTSINGNTVTVTPTAVTPSPQTITLSQTADNNYNAGEVTFSVSVDDSTPYVQPTEVTFNLSNTLFGISTGNNPDEQNKTVDNVTITTGCKSTAQNKTYYDSNHIRFYTDSYLTIEAPIGYVITSITLNRLTNGNWDGTGVTPSAGAFEGTIESTTAPLEWSGYATSVTFNYSKQCRTSSVVVTLSDTPPITVTSAGLATFACDADLDFTDSGLEAYIATENDGIKLTKKDVIPAGTGVLLRALDGGDNDYPVSVTTATQAQKDAVSGNLFVRGTGAAVASSADGYNNYILSVAKNDSNEDEYGFYKAAGKTVAKNRAYLHTTTSAARIAINFNDESAGIAEIEGVRNVENEKVYNLNGQRVNKATNGLYIVNGKKLIFK